MSTRETILSTNICEGCPAGFALSSYGKNTPDQSEGEFIVRARQAEAEKAKLVLDTAAGQTACRSLRKDLPVLPQYAPEAGSGELIALVSECPSFLRYLDLRQRDLE